MNAETLYSEIKAFLNYAGLSFNQMAAVEFSIIDQNTIQLKHEKTRVLIELS